MKQNNDSKPGRPSKYGEKTEALRVPISAVEYTTHLIDTIWLYIKHRSAKEEIIPAIFQNLQRSLFAYLREEQKSAMSGLTSQRRVTFRTPENTPITLPKRYSCAIAATLGQTSTVEQDDTGETTDLHQLLVKQPDEIFILPVVGDSMDRAGIQSGGLVVVQLLTDNWAQLYDNVIVVANIDGNETVKRYKRRNNKDYLAPDSNNAEHQEMELKEGMDAHLIGIVLYSINPLHRSSQFEFKGSMID
jgi:SOS-response transcriptional repressor LexA